MYYDDAGLYFKFKGDTCLNFWYNMRGNGAYSIEVMVDTDRLVLELKGPKDTDWHKAQVEVTGAKKKVAFTLKTHEMVFVGPQYTEIQIENEAIFGSVFKETLAR